MSTPQTDSNIRDSRIRTLLESLRNESLQNVPRLLNSLHPAEIAHLLESLPTHQRQIVWELVDPELDGEVLVEVNEEVRASLIEEMDAQELVSATANLEPDDLADLLQELPDTLTNQILSSLDHQDRARIEAVLSYDEDTAGGLMNPQAITVRAELTIQVVLRYIRLLGELPRGTDTLFVVSRKDRYLGALPLSTLLVAQPDQTVAEIMSLDVTPFSVTTPASEVAQDFERRDLLSAPVVNNTGHLIGRITVDDVLDVIRDEAERSLLGAAGLTEEEDLFAPTLTSAKRRSVWLGLNLATVLLAAWVIGLFEATIAQLTALAVLLPIVASMGGVAGGQTLTLVIRGIALNKVSKDNLMSLVFAELRVGIINGILWALVVSVIAAVWFNNVELGLIIGAAMMVNLITAAAAGTFIPILLDRAGIDPALAGNVFLTTVTDVIGFFAFLALATHFLL